MIVFETQFEKGSYLERFSGVAITNTNGEIKRSEKGYAWLGDGSSAKGLINVPINLNQDWTINVWGKANKDSQNNSWDCFITIGNATSVYTSGLGIATRRFLGIENDGITTVIQNYTNPIVDNKWHLITVTHDVSIKTIVIYIDNVLNGTKVYTGTLFANCTHVTIGYQATGPGYIDGLNGKTIIADHLYSADERAIAYRDFLAAKPFAIEKYPKYNPHTKPTDGSQEAEKGCIYWWNMIPNNTVLVDIASGVNMVRVDKPRQSLDGVIYDGVDDYHRTPFTNLLGGTTGATFLCRFRSTEAGATKYIFAQAFNGVTFYFRLNNNKLEAAVTGSSVITSANNYNDGQWHNAALAMVGTLITLVIDGIVVGDTNDADPLTITADDCISIGASADAGAAANFCSCEVEEARADMRTWTYEEVLDWHNSYAKRVKLIDHFRDAAVGNVPREWKNGTGTYAIAEMATQDAVLKELDKGTKYLQCSVAGTIAIPSKQAYGTWEFAWYKGGDGNQTYAYFINDKNIINDGYVYWMSNAERIGLLKITGGGVNSLSYSAGSYININTWYKSKITRTLNGEFYHYIKGGAFGNTWTLVSVTGGVGTNPVTDNTYATSEYFVLDFDAGDRIALINIQQGVEQ